MNELEERVIAILLSKPELVDSVAVNPNWFSDPRYKDTVEAMQSLDSAERTILNVYNELDKYEGQLSYKDLMNMRDEVFSTASIMNDVKALRKVSAQKAFEEAIALYQLSPKKEELNQLSAALENLKKTDEVEDKGYLDEAIDDLNYRMYNDVPVGIKSFPKLDDMLAGGLYGSMLLTIGARPSVGKTAYSVNLAYQIINNDPEVQVDYFTLEMNKREMLNRFVARHTNISSAKLKQPAQRLTSYEIGAVNSAIDWLRERKLRVYDQVLTLSGILSIIRENASKSKENKYVAIIDYIGLVKVENRRERWEQVGQISRELKIIANEYNVPIVALTQLNRNVESRQDKTPQLSDIRESGSIEQDSNVVAFLHKPNPDNPAIVQLTIQKNREGSLGVIDYYFEGKYMNFVEEKDE
ncbi:DnaB-like helicase C-terminal domain-containing protein [Ligilactobacillus animalis]|uniref:DnaB-like helicase C-terminal domain-containing protein n=1 Tax=Ligilactobacillus animalis TaxID=1605 RepID=A0AAJ6K3L9_9LACO|nr:DnaB-like helicase C-terminal domain-containing protein [Ligilactobacillus animalis]WHQ80647.1 DnaB-like helicase C-terminal domain-containing protein [Ligilactobacillus animalis]